MGQDIFEPIAYVTTEDQPQQLVLTTKEQKRGERNTRRLHNFEFFNKRQKPKNDVTSQNWTIFLPPPCQLLQKIVEDWYLHLQMVITREQKNHTRKNAF